MPWDDLIGLGLGLLRLASHDFWAMTPRELALALRALRGGRAEAPGRAALADMMRRFPDTGGTERDAWPKTMPA